MRGYFEGFPVEAEDVGALALVDLVDEWSDILGVEDLAGDLVAD